MPDFKKIKKILFSDFFRHSATLLSSGAIVQLIAFLTFPLITRLYDNTTFGEFSYFITIVSVLSTIPTGKYELAMLLPKSERKVSALFYLCCIQNAFFLLLSFAILFVFKGSFVSLLEDKPTIIPMIWLIPVFVFLNGTWQALNRLLLRHRKYGNISSFNMTQSIVGTLTKCLIGLKKTACSGLVLGQLTGLTFATLGSILFGRKSIKSLQKINKNDIKQVAKEYSNFPKYELPNQLINTLSANLPILLLSAYFDMAEIGLLSFAFTIGLNPVNLFSGSMAQVLFQRMSERIREKKNIKQECMTFCRTCFFVILPFFALLLFLPESFFSLVFGDKWIGVTLYFRLLLPCFFMSLVVASLSFIPDVFFKQKTAVKIEILYLILKTIALLSGVLLQSFILSIVFYVIVVVIMLSVKLIWYLGLVKKYELNAKG